jgi:hypothetical protein
VIANQQDNRFILFECIRVIFPHLKDFNDEMIEKKIGSKKLDDCISEFILYIQRDGIKTRNERLVEGIKLLKLVQHQMLNYQYPAAAITPKNVTEGLSLLDDYFYRKATREEEHYEQAFPGYSSIFNAA